MLQRRGREAAGTGDRVGWGELERLTVDLSDRSDESDPSDEAAENSPEAGRSHLTMLSRLLLCLFALSPSLFAAPPRPNIVIMLVDDMGVMDTSVPFLTDAEGKPKRYPLNNFYRTPNMERLAARGVRFNNFCAMSVCSPTRISIMTGQNAARHRTTNWINPDTDNAGPQGPHDWNWKGLKPGDVTLPGVLREAGYRPIHVGQGHFAPPSFHAAVAANIGLHITLGGGPHSVRGTAHGETNH